MTYLTGRKKNTLRLVAKAISLIEIKQQIIQWRIQNGKSLIQKVDSCSVKTFFWTGTPTEFVEWAYGMLESKRINDGDLEVEEFIKDLAQVFSIEIKDCYNTFRAIRRRTGSRTAFLDEMIEKLEKRMDDMDNGVFKKKRKK